MSDSQSAEMERIAGALQASIRKTRIPGARVPGVSPASDSGSIDLDLGLLVSNYDISSAPFTSHRRVLGRLIIFAKNLARELLVQLLARQSAYNGAATRVISHLKRKIDSMADEQARLAQRLADLETRLDAHASRTAPAKAGISAAPASARSEPGDGDRRGEADEKRRAPRHP